MLKEEKVLDTKINTGYTLNSAVMQIETLVKTKTFGHYICTTNPEFIMDCQKDLAFRNIVNHADLSLPDGIGVLLAIEYERRLGLYQKYKGTLVYPILAFMTGIGVGIDTVIHPETLATPIPGVNLTESVCKLCAEKGLTLFVLGGRAKNFFGKTTSSSPDVASAASTTLQHRYPNINIVGATSQFNRTENDDVASVAYIKQCMSQQGIDHIDILLVAYNHVYQEKWIARNAALVPATVSIGVGGTLDYMTGIKRQSPLIATKRNLGWLFRLITQPWRFKRIFNAFPLFPLHVYMESLH